MRLLDADNLKKEIEDRKDYNPESEFDRGYNLGIETALAEIKKAPTIYPEEISKLIETCIRELPQLIDAMTKNLPQIIEAATEKIIEEDTRSEQERWRDGE